MKYIIVKLTAARDIAAACEGDIRIQEFLRAMRIRPDAAGGNLSLSIDCHCRSWYRCVRQAEAAELEAMSQAELAAIVAGWVQEALNSNLLLISNPPMSGALEFPAVGAVVSFTYDRDCMLVGKRWS